MSKWEFSNIQSVIESAKIEIMKGNKVVMYKDTHGQYVLIVWDKEQG